jgi:hypothetical protein
MRLSDLFLPVGVIRRANWIVFHAKPLCRKGFICNMEGIINLKFA